MTIPFHTRVSGWQHLPAQGTDLQEIKALSGMDPVAHGLLSKSQELVMKKLLALLVVLLALVGLLLSDLIGHSGDGVAMASAPGAEAPATVKRGTPRPADTIELRQVIRKGSE